MQAVVEAEADTALGTVRVHHESPPARAKEATKRLAEDIKDAGDKIRERFAKIRDGPAARLYGVGQDKGGGRDAARFASVDQAYRAGLHLQSILPKDETQKLKVEAQAQLMASTAAATSKQKYFGGRQRSH